ncbi:DNA topoisomerase 3 [Neolecta irregularis DAH-3]|uniref:DNA topoisomerase n=1 Tax=Neolecta irregularis (strain DAH-3) TaxID=1198029 RepID=A0A1U7LU01_NEOID|nr:DNA topoisomerase 3 [Neolecta irregularis DAH-3]|eukprot:OLL26150.1 DNA topoisomerase 3 [Neolecta irregularis DAH-3]
MPRVFCVAEKPSVAKAVASALGGGRFQTSNTTNRFIKNYETEFRFRELGESSVVVSSVAGHLTSLDFDSNFSNWRSCRPIDLFEAAIVKKTPESNKAIEKNIKTQSRRSQYLIIWTDCDREGEHIGTEIANAAKEANPRIDVLRARFSNVEAQHIIQAAGNLVRIDEKQAAAVDARIELDLRIGSAFTRFQTLELQSRYAELARELISYGSCQFPTLGFVVDRWLRVKKFVPETFWLIKVVYRRENMNVNFSWKRNHLFDRLIVMILYERCLESGPARVASVIKKPASKWQPLPLTTVELQKQGSRFLRLSSKIIMDHAEKLYQKGFISYPRTETDQFDKEINLQALLGKQTENQEWGQYAQRLLEGEFKSPRRGRNNDKAHPPIHPIAHLAPSGAGISSDMYKVYTFIARRFIACCWDDAKGNRTTVEIDWFGERFTAQGLVVLQKNYLEVYNYEKWESSEELPPFMQGEIFVPTVAEMVEGKTNAPTYLTEPDLIAMMDANGIGTDATMADHIAKIEDRKYIFKQPRQNGVMELRPSTLGAALIEGYDQMNFEQSLGKPFLRKDMETKMKDICEGRRTRDGVVREELERYREVFAKVSRNLNILREV